MGGQKFNVEADANNQINIPCTGRVKPSDQCPWNTGNTQYATIAEKCEKLCYVRWPNRPKCEASRDATDSDKKDCESCCFNPFRGDFPGRKLSKDSPYCKCIDPENDVCKP